MRYFGIYLISIFALLNNFLALTEASHRSFASVVYSNSYSWKSEVFVSFRWPLLRRKTQLNYWPNFNKTPVRCDISAFLQPPVSGLGFFFKFRSMELVFYLNSVANWVRAKKKSHPKEFIQRPTKIGERFLTITK